MRSLFVALLTLIIALAGCSGDDDAEADPILDDEPLETETVVPEDIEDSQLVILSIEPSNNVGDPCGIPAQACNLYPFTVESGSRVDVAADLTFTLPTSDFDLYLYQGDTQLATSGNLNGAPESISASLRGGDYEFRVVGWLVVADTYTFTADFEAA